MRAKDLIKSHSVELLGWERETHCGLLTFISNRASEF